MLIDAYATILCGSASARFQADRSVRWRFAAGRLPVADDPGSIRARLDLMAAEVSGLQVLASAVGLALHATDGRAAPVLSSSTGTGCRRSR